MKTNKKPQERKRKRNLKRKKKRRTRANTGHAVLQSTLIPPRMKRRNGPMDQPPDRPTDELLQRCFVATLKTTVCYLFLISSSLFHFCTCFQNVRLKVELSAHSASLRTKFCGNSQAFLNETRANTGHAVLISTSKPPKLKRRNGRGRTDLKGLSV